MVNVLMAGGYCHLFIVTFRHPVGRTLRVFLTATAFSTVYSVVFGYAQWWPWAIVFSSVVRLFPPAEAIWRVWRDRGKSRVLAGHAVLQLAWMILQAVITALYPLMTTPARYNAGRWVYVIGAMGIISAYHRVFSSPRSAAQAGPAEDRQPEMAGRV